MWLVRKFFRIPLLPFPHPAMLLATWGGVGLMPKAAGTFGSLAALPFAFVLHGLGGGWLLLAAATVLYFVGWWATSLYVAGHDDHDPNEVVVDEVVGQWLVLCFAPQEWWVYGLGFFLFRLFDVWKPWPIRWADRHVESAFGVMLDDVLAAGYAAAALWAILLGFGLADV